MFSIYSKLKQNFDFLEEYGYEYSGKFKHFVHPSIKFKKQDILVQVGYSYETRKISLYIYNPKCIDVLENEVGLERLSYKEQLEICLIKLKDYLQIGCR